jgi:glycine oxidase
MLRRPCSGRGITASTCKPSRETGCHNMKKHSQTHSRAVCGCRTLPTCAIPACYRRCVSRCNNNPRCVLREFSPVQQLENNAAVLVSGERVAGGEVVVCAGAWAGQLLHGVGVNVPVAPVLGQMLLYRQPADWLRTIVLHDGRYAIPRADGHVLVGSTLEQRGFDKSITDDACADLRRAAGNMLPGLRDATPVRQWAGLRPGSPEGVPLMGKVPGYTNLWLCAGHFRNGLVLSPASTQLMADLLLQRTPALDAAPYQLFAGERDSN